MPSDPSIDAIVLAGGTPDPAEPLYALTQGRPKALLPMAGRPMVQWVLDALGGVPMIRRVVVIGLEAEQAPALTGAQGLGFERDHGSLIDNLMAGARWLEARGSLSTQLLAVSSDIPLLTPTIVDWILRTGLETDHDAYYSIIPYSAMERRFPGSRRSYFRLKEGRFTAGDLTLLKASLFSGYNPAWHQIVAARKNLLKQALLVGLDSLILIALGQLSISGAERRVRERLGVNGRVLICPYAEAGMDVDKPGQYALVARELEKLQTTGSGG